MPVLAIFRAEGDPDDLLARYDETLPAAGWPDEVIDIYEIHNQGWPVA
jgi:hypothetical protein